MMTVLTGSFLHSIEEHNKSAITFRAPNTTLPGNFANFMCNVPHLMKTFDIASVNSIKTVGTLLIVSHVQAAI